MASRGIRNNNPGNIEKGQPWQGLAENQNSDKRFCVFKAPEWGIRAIVRTLITYQDKRRAKDGSKIDTIEDIVNRWAPPFENNTTSYSRAVSLIVGKAVNETIDVRDYDVMFKLVIAIIKHENGYQPYSTQQINKGLMLAGIEAPVKPLNKSRTMKGASIAGASVVVPPVVTYIDTIKDSISPFVDIQTIAVIFAVLGIVGASLVVYARINDHIKEGR
jgi:hypothetical protein